MHRDSCPLDCKVYLTELERTFGYYGPLRSVNPPCFAFAEFENPQDAADAVRELECSGRISAHYNLRLLGSSNSSASAS
uniref:RRM domain-containing protein n=1 Tax=Cebus imitator TaxID=2715852 RepID=A0A2K5P8T8_CEBIM